MAAAPSDIDMEIDMDSDIDEPSTSKKIVEKRLSC